MKFSGKTLMAMLKVNLNLDITNPDNIIPADKSVIRIENTSPQEFKIENILAKVSTFRVKGNVELGTVLICPIDKISTLLWVEMANIGSMLLDRLFIGGNHDIVIAPDGSISVVRNKNMLTGGSDVYASVSSASARDYIYVEAGKGIRFDGKIHVINAVGLFTQEGDIIINGNIISGNSIVVAARAGEVIVSNAELDAKAIAIYSHSSSYFQDAVLKAQEIVSYSLNGYINIVNCDISVCNIVVVAGDDIRINSSTSQSGDMYIHSGGSVNIAQSELISHRLFVQSIHDYLQVSSNIKLVQHPHVLFANQPSLDQSIIKGGIKLATGVELIGVYGQPGGASPAKLTWQQVGNIDKVQLNPASAYIETNRGFIVGSGIDAGDTVIIRARDSIAMVPVVLYNEVIDAGGLNQRSIAVVISKINAGTIDIDARNAATFVGSILSAATGSISADVIHLLDSPEQIRNQQERIKVLSGFADLKDPQNPTVADYLNFSKATSIAQRISNLSVYDDFASRQLYFTQTVGDVILDRPLITNYDQLHINAAHGKILIVSENLQSVYQGSGGADVGCNAALDARTIIGGENVYLSADEVVAQAGKFNVTGTLKIVARDGVYLLPVSVHQSLMYHRGSKTTISENEIRLVVSEINAGYLDIEAGGALTAVSTLIQATGVSLDVGELNLLSEREIFEKRILFIGKEKCCGGRNESHDYFRDEIVIPTLIKTDHINARVNGKTTIEAAQILENRNLLLLREEM